MLSLLLLACGASSPESEQAVEQPTPPSIDEISDPVAELRERLQDPPEDVGAMGQAFAALATTLGVGTVRCPSAGAGRVRRIYGTPRDRLDLGISYRIAQPEDPVPWSPSFDEVAIEDGWVTMLAQPGSTEGFVRATHGVQRVTWPPAEAGKTVMCTSIELVAKRAVVGRIEPAAAGIVDGSCLSDLVKLGKDGTFVVEADPPCTLWLLTEDGRRSAALPVPPGDGKLDLGLVDLPSDPYQDSDGHWTEEGRKRIHELIEVAEADIAAREALIVSLDDDAPTSLVRFWRRTLHSSKRDVENLRRMLLQR